MLSVFVFQMQCGITRCVAQQHTVSQVLEDEVTNANETSMLEKTRNIMGEIEDAYFMSLRSQWVGGVYYRASINFLQNTTNYF